MLVSLDSANEAWRTPEAGHAGGVRACAVASSVNRFVACDDRRGLVVWRPALVVEPAVEDDDAPQIRVDVALAAEADDADDLDALRREFEESAGRPPRTGGATRGAATEEEPRRRRRRRVGDVVAAGDGSRTTYFVCCYAIYSMVSAVVYCCQTATPLVYVASVLLLRDETSRVADSSSKPADISG